MNPDFLQMINFYFTDLGKSKITLLIFFSLFFYFCQAQQRDIDSTLSILHNHLKEDSVRVKALSHLSSLYQSSNLKNAEYYAAQALTIAQKINDDVSICVALSQLSSVYSWQRKTTAALNASFQQLEIAAKLNSGFWLQKAYLRIGYVYELENEWGKALSYTLKALPYAEQTGDPLVIGYVYDYIGSEYLGVGNIKSAEEYLRKACSLLMKNGNMDELGDSRINLAKVFDATGNFDSAKYYFDAAVSIFTDRDEPYQIADAYQQMGDMYQQRGMYKEAKECYKKTILNYNKNDVAEADYALAVLGLGTVAWAEKQYDTASKIFHEEFAKVRDAGITEPQLKYLKYMAMADSAAGNYKEAFNHMQYYALLFDSSYNEKKTQATQRMLIEFDVQRKEKENEQLKLQNVLEKQRTAIFAISGSVLFIAGIFLSLLYKQKTAALTAVKHLQHTTENKNNELAVINAVKNKLISMIAHDVRSPLTSLQNILYLTREKILDEEEFKRLSLMLDSDIRHIISMLDNTLLWAREQIHALTINKVSFDLSEMTEDVISLYNQAIQDKNIKVENLIPAQYNVFTDKNIIHTVMRNMLSNAIKFTPPGKRIFFQVEKNAGHAEVTIKDEGEGISKEILEKINKKEFISTRGTNNEKGTGLGLMFSFELLSKLGEKIAIKTVPGQGTAITFSIATQDAPAS
ncbi:MAG TPA: tetratricopeptide repeat protein [Panacibacter sp.]|nr:tetratricopeptide repeat protein [Panacibacter sp.]